MKCWLAGCIVVVGWAGAQAAPLDPKVVASDAVWYVHVDADLARQSPVVKQVHAHIMQHERAKKHLAEMKDKVGFDPTHDLHSVTLYGNKLEPRQGLLVVKADADRARATKQLQGKSDFKSTSYGDDTLLSWTERGRRRDRSANDGEKGGGKDGEAPRHTVVVGFAQNSQYVVGRSEDAVKAGLDVINGKSASLSPLAADTPAGAIVQAKASGLSEAKLPVRSPIFKQIDYFSMTLGDVDGQMFVDKKIGAKSAEVAGQIQAIVEGFRALGQLRSGSNEAMQDVFEGIHAETSGATVSVHWQADDDKVLALLAELDQLRKQMIERREKARPDAPRDRDDDRPRRRGREERRDRDER